MLWTHALAAILAAAAAATGAWRVQDWRYTGQIATMRAEAATAQAEAVREARATESRRFLEVQNAQRQAAARAAEARRDAAAAQSAADGLRDDLAGALRTHSTSLASCNDGARLVGDLFGQCVGAYRDLAATADRLDNDRRTLMEAWPR